MNKSDRRIKVANLLRQEELSSKEIAEKLGVKTNLVSPIISELRRQGKIHSVLPRKYVWGIRHESGKNTFLINKDEWVELDVYKLKIFYKKSYTFRGYSESGELYFENHSLFEFYRDNQLLIPIEVFGQPEDKGNEIETQTEFNIGEEIIRINLKCTVVSSKTIKIKVRYKSTNLTAAEIKLQKEQEDEMRKELQKWMNNNLK